MNSGESTRNQIGPLRIRRFKTERNGSFGRFRKRCGTWRDAWCSNRKRWCIQKKKLTTVWWRMVMMMMSEMTSRQSVNSAWNGRATAVSNGHVMRCAGVLQPARLSSPTPNVELHVKETAGRENSCVNVFTSSGRYVSVSDHRPTVHSVANVPRIENYLCVSLCYSIHCRIMETCNFD